jgi:DNA repair protein RadA/Sms
LPRRTTAGIDLNRLLLLTAVLSKRAGLPLGSQDVFVNVAGGMRLDEPAADLATVVAIASSLVDVPVPEFAVMGEVGLGGEVRSITRLRDRVAEANKLGFSRCVVPKRALRELPEAQLSSVIGVCTVQEALAATSCSRSSIEV